MPIYIKPKFHVYGRLPAGKYYVGDPCYVIPDERWSTFCKAKYTDSNKPPKVGVFWLPEGTKYANFDTKYGDGLYESSGKTEQMFYVDSGSIACIPVDALPNDKVEIAKGHVIHFDKKFFVGYDAENGMIMYDNLYIPTGWLDEDSSDESEA
tara:strand:+ start:77 stop:532 length:456 start_codon:yes stop_codon:yes gene_type:complete